MKYKEVIMRYIYNINKENTVCIYDWTCASHSMTCVCFLYIASSDI